MSNYTEAQVNALIAHGAFTYGDALEFAEQWGLKHRSVIAKVKSLGLPYEPKPAKVTKRGEPVVSKGEYIAAIEAVLGFAVPSLIKVTKADLVALHTALAK